MSQTFDLITSQGNRFILNKESLSYISKIKEEVVLVILLSSTDDNNLLGNIKLSLLSSILNNNIPNSNEPHFTQVIYEKRIPVLMFY